VGAQECAIRARSRGRDQNCKLRVIHLDGAPPHPGAAVDHDERRPPLPSQSAPLANACNLQPPSAS
jgi:hypothetical protein